MCSRRRPPIGRPKPLGPRAAPGAGARPFRAARRDGRTTHGGLVARPIACSIRAACAPAAGRWRTVVAARRHALRDRSRGARRPRAPARRTDPPPVRSATTPTVRACRADAPERLAAGRRGRRSTAGCWCSTRGTSRSTSIAPGEGALRRRLSAPAAHPRRWTPHRHRRHRLPAAVGRRADRRSRRPGRPARRRAVQARGERATSRRRGPSRCETPPPAVRLTRDGVLVEPVRVAALARAGLRAARRCGSASGSTAASSTASGTCST